MKTYLKIGELSQRTGTQVETIRYYEREGLMPSPARSDGNYRLYDSTHAERLSFIRHCRSLDMTLDEIRILLRFRDSPNENCADVNTLLDEHIGHVADRIEDLQELERQLKELRRRCRRARASKDCGILNKLATPTNRANAAAHVHGTHGRRVKQ